MKKLWVLFIFTLLFFMTSCRARNNQEAQDSSLVQRTLTVSDVENTIIPEFDTAHVTEFFVDTDLDIGFTTSAETALIELQSEEEQEPVITVVRMPADFKGEYHFFTDDQTGETMLFLTTESVENFAYVEIYPFIDPNDDFYLHVGEVFFSLDDFTPEKPFVVTTYIGSGIPARAIHFEYKGTVKYFYITESGMDSSLMLIEFTPFME